MTIAADVVSAASGRGLAVPRPVLAAAAMAVLAGLDLLGALLARHWSEASGPGRLVYFGAGVAVFVLLFAVYARSLQFAELVPVTFGWIALLQVSLLIVDAAGRRPVPAGHWMAAAGIILLEGYLLFAD